MAEKTVAEELGLKYKKAGDYLIPDFGTEKQQPETIGKYGRMREKFLMDEHPGLYKELQLNGKLPEHLCEINRSATEMMNQLTAQMAKQRGITEKLKMTDQMRWVQEMNSIQASAEEIILKQLVYSN